MPSDTGNDQHDARELDRETIRAWILGAVIALVSLVGLGIASRAEDLVFYLTGLGLFVLGVLFIFWLIYRYVGR
jgi:hypothetical protein